MRWVPVYGYEGFYEVSDGGQVRRILKDGFRIMAQSIVNGYKAVKLCKDNKPKAVKVHRVVLEAFERPFREGEQTNHKNGNKQDNQLSNLERCSMTQNIRHRIDVLGADHHSFASKLSKTDVVAIRKLHAEGFSGCAIARMFKVSSTPIYNIIHGKTWKHI